LKKGVKNDIVKTIDELMSLRRKTQPVELPSAGCIFKNPPGVSAGQLIDRAGLKGVSLGGARVSEKHADFIVNTGDARAADVRALIAMVHEKVKEQHGVNLELEIKIIGE